MRESKINWERRRALPYGVWHLADRSEVLFNRSYEPIIGRTNKGVILQIVPKSWVHWTCQQWFYNDGTPSKQAMDTAIKVFQAFVARGDIQPFVLERYKDVLEIAFKDKPVKVAHPFPAFLENDDERAIPDIRK